MSVRDSLPEAGAAEVFASVDGIPDLGAGDSERERVLASLPLLARRLLRAEFGVLTIIGPDHRVARMYVSGLSTTDAARIGVPPTGMGLLGRMVPGATVLRVDSVAEQEQFTGYPRGHPEVGTLLGVAVENDGRHAANLYLANGPGGRGFSERDEMLVQMLARAAASALENARLYRVEGELRREAEAARRWLEAVLREAAAGIIVVDAASGEVLLVSPEAGRILGTPLSSGAPPERYERAVRYLRTDGTPFAIEDLPMQQAMATGRRSGPAEVIFERPDGRRIPTLVSAAPVPGEEGGRGAVIAVFQDTSRLKELDQVKSDFLSMITHDLRSPLATIKGLVSVAVAQLDPESDAKADLEAADEEVDQMTDLVSNLLDMSRIEAGSHPLQRERCHMVDLAEDAVRRAAKSRLGAGRRVVVNVAPDLPALYADPGQIGRVLDNLLSNALKYSDDPIMLESSLEEGKERIITEVTDRGIGVPEEQQSAVFDKFFRVTGGSRAGRGAGLGLAICKSIVEAHSGTIGVDSVDGAGSTFWFTIPVYAEPPAPSQCEQ